MYTTNDPFDGALVVPADGKEASAQTTLDSDDVDLAERLYQASGSWISPEEAEELGILESE